MPCERWRQRFCRRPILPRTCRRRRTRRCNLLREFLAFPKLGCFQPSNLPLQGSYARDLANSRRNAEKQQVPRNVKRTRSNVALVRVFFHLNWPGKFLSQIAGDFLMNCLVRRQQRLTRLLVHCGVLRGELRWSNKPGFREVLISRRPRLPIPQLLVFDLGCREFRHTFETQDRVPQIGDGCVPVLKVEALEKFLRVMASSPIPSTDEWNRVSGCTVPARTRIFPAASARLLRHGWLSIRE